MLKEEITGVLIGFKHTPEHKYQEQSLTTELHDSYISTLQFIS